MSSKGEPRFRRHGAALHGPRWRTSTTTPSQAPPHRRPGRLLGVPGAAVDFPFCAGSGTAVRGESIPPPRRPSPPGPGRLPVSAHPSAAPGMRAVLSAPRGRRFTRIRVKARRPPTREQRLFTQMPDNARVARRPAHGELPPWMDLHHTRITARAPTPSRTHAGRHLSPAPASLRNDENPAGADVEPGGPHVPVGPTGTCPGRATSPTCPRRLPEARAYSWTRPSVPSSPVSARSAGQKRECLI